MSWVLLAVSVFAVVAAADWHRAKVKQRRIERRIYVRGRSA